MHAAVKEEIRIEQGHEVADESLQSYLNTWLEEYKKGAVAKNTFELHEHNIKNHIVPTLKIFF
ncbi:hypothetical protein [Peribacillus asahii]|uniref:hypothetical protein n=1 Tax=Peribacillus asahii TaxID=228899 RepID=UPI00381B6323